MSMKQKVRIGCHKVMQQEKHAKRIVYDIQVYDFVNSFFRKKSLKRKQIMHLNNIDYLATHCGTPAKPPPTLLLPNPPPIPQGALAHPACPPVARYST